MSCRIRCCVILCQISHETCYPIAQSQSDNALEADSESSIHTFVLEPIFSSSESTTIELPLKFFHNSKLLYDGFIEMSRHRRAD